MCNFCCKFASDFNMRGPIRTGEALQNADATGRLEAYRTATSAYRTGGDLQDC